MFEGGKRVSSFSSPRNPLGIIALFVSFIEAVATVSLKIVSGGPPAILWCLVVFIIVYPSMIATAFFLVLWKRREILFGPMDYSDPAVFERLLTQRFERLEIKQKAVTIDSTSDPADVFRAVDTLLAIEDSWAAIQIGRGFLEKKEYSRGLSLYEYILSKLKQTDNVFYKALANAAYCKIGLRDYQGAIELLKRVDSIAGGEHFWTWHALAAAYCCHQTGNHTGMKEYMNRAKVQIKKKGRDIDDEFFCGLYPEISDDIKGLRE